MERLVYSAGFLLFHGHEVPKFRQNWIYALGTQYLFKESRLSAPQFNGRSPCVSLLQLYLPQFLLPGYSPRR